MTDPFSVTTPGWRMPENGRKPVPERILLLRAAIGKGALVDVSSQR